MKSNFYVQLLVLIAIALISSSFTFSEKSNIYGWLSGEWQGTGYQIDGAKWEVRLNASSKNKITVDYPDLSCGGTWKIVRETSEIIYLEETITKGKDLCDIGVEVEVKKVSDTEIIATFFLRSYSKNYIAKATLYQILAVVNKKHEIEKSN